MTWRSLIVGVDSSSAGVAAARAGVELAKAMGTTCTLVHAARNVWLPAGGKPGEVDLADLATEIERLSGEELQRALGEQIPRAHLAQLVVRVGPAVKVLEDEARSRSADLVVLGAKHHSVVGRWLGGSTAKSALRGLDLSVLVSTAPRRWERILVAVDLSDAAGPTIASAERMAELFDASLRVLHAIEPFPYAVEGAIAIDLGELDRQQEEAFRSTIQPKIRYGTAEVVIRRNGAVQAIAEEAVTWRPDLVVVGAHGRGRLERLMLGSVSDAVVQMLPASVLVVRGAGPGG